jgi:hypothetical protein
MNDIKYYYLVMDQKDLLENQGFEEILRERSTYISLQKKERDFWLIVSPKFLFFNPISEKLKLTNFYQNNYSKSQKKLENNFSVSLISLDKDFINWIQLRLGYFENIDDYNFVKDKKENKYKSDGIKGSFVIKSDDNKIINNPLLGYKNYIHPDIILEKNKKFLNLYYKILNKNELRNLSC